MSQIHGISGALRGHSPSRRRRRAVGNTNCVLQPLESRILLSEVGVSGPTTVVHWWGDYVRSEAGKQEYGNRHLQGHDGRRIEDIDLDGDGDITDDEVLYWSFSMEDQLNPPGPDSGMANWGYLTDRPSAKFYGGMVVWNANYKPTWTDWKTGKTYRLGVDQVTVEGAEGANPQLPPDPRYPHDVVRGEYDVVPDDKYSDIAVFPYGSETLPLPTKGPDDLSAFRAILLWKKEDFLNAGNAASHVLLDSSSLLSVDVTRHWRNLTARWVVQNGDAFYASEATIDRNGPNGVDMEFGKVNSVVPTETRWAQFDPTAVASPQDWGYLDFDALGANWEYREFDDVRSVGIHLEQDQLAHYAAGIAFVMDNIRVDASLVPGPAGIIGFSSSKSVVDESVGILKVAVSRTDGSWGVATVDYATGGGTATPGDDYAPVSGTLTFASGQTTGFIEIAITHDALLEKAETIRVTLSNVTGGPSLSAITSTSLTIRDPDVGVIAFGSSEGGTVRAFSLASHAVRFTVQPYGRKFKGGLRVATGDVNGDLVPDVIVTPAVGVAPTVFVYDGLTGALLRRFDAYAKNYTGGVLVAAGDVNGDGKAEIITGPGPGILGEVRVFDRKGKLVRRFNAYGSRFKAGVIVAAGDMNGDGFADIVTAPGPGATTLVKVFDGVSFKKIRTVYPYDYAAYNGGVNLAAGDLDGDGKDDLIVSPLPIAGLLPRVRVFRSSQNAGIRSDPLYEETYRGGLSVAAVDVDGDAKDDILVVPTSSYSTLMLAIDGETFADRGSFWPFGKRSRAGMYLAASQ